MPLSWENSSYYTKIFQAEEGTCSVASLREIKRGKKSGTRAKKRARARRVRIGAPDPRLTPAAGVEALREVDRVLGVTAALDGGIGAVKKRARGLTGGELLLAMASAQLAGEDFLVGLDRRRADTAGQELEPVPTPASTTAAGIAKRFGGAQLQGIEKGIGTVNTTMVSLLPLVRRTTLLKVATIDGDATDVEVYGRKKEKAKHAYTGALTVRSHIGFWAEAGIPVAAELMGGTEDPRSNAVDVLDRSIAALPAGVEKVQCRWDGRLLRRGAGRGVCGTRGRLRHRSQAHREGHGRCLRAGPLHLGAGGGHGRHRTGHH